MRPAIPSSLTLRMFRHDLIPLFLFERFSACFMDRRALLVSFAAASGSVLSGCNYSSIIDSGTPETASPTEDTGRTVRVGPNSPGCPRDSWGQMGAIPETYNQTVDTVKDAKQVATGSDNETGDSGYRLIEPRPDVIKWKNREIALADKYDTDTWFLFDAGGQDLIAVLVVQIAEEQTEVVRFYVGAC